MRKLKAGARDILKNAGKISAKIAKDHAETEFEKYRIIQDRLFESESDFDKEMKAIALKMDIKKNMMNNILNWPALVGQLQIVKSIFSSNLKITL